MLNKIISYNSILSLQYPGQCYSGFNVDVTCNTENNTLEFQLKDDRHPLFKCPKIELSFRQMNKNRVVEVMNFSNRIFNISKVYQL